MFRRRKYGGMPRHAALGDTLLLSVLDTVPLLSMSLGKRCRVGAGRPSPAAR